MRLIVNGPTPTGTGLVDRLLVRLTLSNPDHLEALQRQAMSVSEPMLRALSERFSRTIAGLRFDRAYKRTAQGRLREADRSLAERIGDGHVAGAAERLEILDLGASDGITSLDLARMLAPRLVVPVVVTAADRDNVIDVWRNGPLTEYRSAEGRPVLVRLGRFGVRLPRSGVRFDWLGDLLAASYMALSPLRGGMRRQRAITLTNPEVLASGQIAVVRLDALKRDASLAGRFHVVRCCNILNREYFNARDMQTILGNIHDYLVPEGLLLVSRNSGPPEDEREDGSIWRADDRGFRRITDFGDGSEIGQQVDAFAGPVAS